MSSDTCDARCVVGGGQNPDFTSMKQLSGGSRFIYLSLLQPNGSVEQPSALQLEVWNRNLAMDEMLGQVHILLSFFVITDLSLLPE